MVKTDIRIIFDSPTNVYASGQTVNGKVFIEAEEEMKARAIVMHLVGKAQTSWSCNDHRETYTDSSGRQQTRSKSYSVRESEDYFDNKTILWPGNQDDKLPAGSHQFNFSYTLPFICPPSYEGHYGYIRYYCKVKIDRPWKFDITASLAFTVIPCFNLNTIPYAMNSIMKDATKNLGFICKSGRISARLFIPKSGYVPGEHVVAYIEINNTSSKNVEKIEASLLEIAQFYGRCQGNHNVSKEYSRTIAKTEKGITIEPSRSSQNQISLQIPPVVPSFNVCRLIQVEYLFEVKIEADGFLNHSLRIEIPILIGTIPTVSAPIGPTIQPPPAVQSFDKLIPPQPSAPPIEINGPPPSYEEAIQDPEKSAIEDDEETKELGGFRPKYQYYPMPEPQTTPVELPKGNFKPANEDSGCCVIA